MSSLKREPIELMEFLLPRCANTFGSAPCTATGKHCYNTRATCKDPDNYRDVPDRNLDLSKEYPHNASFAGLFADDDGVEFEEGFFSVKAEVPADGEGIIWYYGDPENYGAYFGVTGGQLIFRVGDLGTEASSDKLELSVDASQFYGKSIVFYGDIDWNRGASSEINLWAYDPVERTIQSLGQDVATVPDARFYTYTLGGVSGIKSFAPTSTYLSLDDWPGFVNFFYMYDDQTAPDNMEGTYGQSLWLGKGVKGEPRDEVYIFPCLMDVGTVGTLINVGGADNNYKPLGRQATLDFSASDFTHSDITQDPYLDTRGFDPREMSTFWRKWVIRQKFGKVGARVRRYLGYAGQKLSEYKKTSYTLEQTSWNEDGISFYCRDEFARTEFDKVQVPESSDVSLREDILSTDTTIDVTYDDGLRWAGTPGVVRINNELITYDSISVLIELVDDEENQYLQLSSLTRGDYETEADDHDADEIVQQCRLYDDAPIDDVVHDFLIKDAGLDAQFVDVAGLRTMAEDDLAAYRVNSLLTTPFSVNELLGRLSTECAFYLWWDERQQQIRFQAIKAVDAGDIVQTITFEKNIVAGSFKITEKPKQRLNTVTFYYNVISPAGDLSDTLNYQNALKIVNGENSLPEQYGDYVQGRSVFSLFLTTEAQANQTSSRLAARYSDIPWRAEFYLDANDRDLWTGDIIRISHPAMVIDTGARDTRRWLIIEAEEIKAGHLMRYVAMDISLDGFIYRITSNNIGDYTPELFAAGHAFITDDNGFNADGTEGARIT